MQRRLAIPVLTIALVITAFLGIREHLLRRQVEIQAENQYQRAFQELSYHLDGIEAETAKALVASSPKGRMQTFSDIWRHASAAQANIGQLPLLTVPLTKTEQFIGRLGAFTYSLAVKNAQGQPITASEWATLRDLHRQAKFMSTTVGKMQASFMNEGSRWNDIQRAMAATSAERPGAPRKPRINPATKSLKMLEDGMRRFPDPDFAGNIPPEKISPRGLTGPVITETRAIEIARRFIGPERTEGKQFTVTRVVTDPRSYRVTVADPGGGGGDQGASMRVDISEKGGHVIWMLDDRRANVSKLSLDRATEIGTAFLESRGFKNMRPIDRDQYQNVAIITYVFEQDGVLIYPDAIKLRIALDNGAILGFEGSGYITFHRARVLPMPALTMNEARAMVSPRLDITSARLAVILDDLGREKLCYEFRGRLDTEEFRVYIDAVTGQEEKIERITPRRVEVT
ncbi:MAG TPA: germination protein YpeB [Firmicutes bacterium]|nr:germination protein YpeB [Bacillota bacterium]